MSKEKGREILQGKGNKTNKARKRKRGKIQKIIKEDKQK